MKPFMQSHKRLSRIMKKIFILENLDCANCAQKMEDAIRKINGVQEVTVSFMAQKITLTADDARYDEIVKEMVKVCKRVEPDCKLMV